MDFSSNLVDLIEIDEHDTLKGVHIMNWKRLYLLLYKDIKLCVQFSLFNYLFNIIYSLFYRWNNIGKIS